MIDRIHRYSSPDELTNGMAGQLAAHLASLQHSRERIHLALTGGDTALGVYQRLATLIRAANVDISRLEIWWTSERWVPTTDPHRNSTRALVALASMLPDAAQVHAMPTSTASSDPTQAAVDYAHELGETTFDVALLGVGTDGHVAAMYPGHPSFQDGRDKPVAIGVDEAPFDPPGRVSLTLPMLNRSDQVWLMACGADKADAVTRALAHDETLPASLVHGQSMTHWFLDDRAARDLPRYHCRF